MKISDILKDKKSFSFEVFPPKEEKPLGPLLETLDGLYGFNPDFISCTYGAGGTNKGRSLEVCKAINDTDHETMTHFTCIGNDEAQVKDLIEDYIDIGIENVLLLRGDLPEGWTETKGSFSHADQLIEFIRSSYPELCIGAAAYPEKHVESDTVEEDIHYLKRKQDVGAAT